jgi:hypothetical protein
MRPLPIDWSWDPVDFDIHDPQCIDMMYNARPRDERYRNSIVACTFTPRQYIENVDTEYIQDVATVHTSVCIGPTIRPDTYVHEIGPAYAKPIIHNSEEAGLLLDMNAGTLSYFRNGMFESIIMNGLQGEYVWVVTFPQDSGLHREHHFSCKQY